MTEDQLEKETLSWLVETGYSHHHGADIAPDSAAPERSDYRQVLLSAPPSAAIALVKDNAQQALAKNPQPQGLESAHAD